MRQLPLFVTNNKWDARRFVFSIIVVSLVALGLQMGRASVQAQSEATPAASIAPYSQQLDELARTYRGQVQEYQTKERAYIIAKTDFIQLETLASLESAIQASRELTIIRNQVLETYLQQLRVTLVATPGIEVPVKERATERLETLLEVLDLHSQAAAQAETRAELDQISAAFELILPELTHAAYFSLGLIEYGQLRSVTDQTRNIFDQLQAEDVSQLSATAQAQRTRNLQVIDDQFSLADQQFILLLETILEDEDDSDENSFRRLKSDLNEVFAQATRIQNFLDEII